MDDFVVDDREEDGVSEDMNMEHSEESTPETSYEEKTEVMENVEETEETPKAEEYEEESTIEEKEDEPTEDISETEETTETEAEETSDVEEAEEEPAVEEAEETSEEAEEEPVVEEAEDLPEGTEETPAVEEAEEQEEIPAVEEYEEEPNTEEAEEEPVVEEAEETPVIEEYKTEVEVPSAHNLVEEEKPTAQELVEGVSEETEPEVEVIDEPKEPEVEEEEATESIKIYNQGEEPKKEEKVHNVEFKSGRREHELDKELEEILKKQKAKIKVVGCGGAGNNTINRISEVGIFGCETIAINTDAQDLLYTSSDVKILIGRELTQGLGAGSIPKVGEEAAKEQEQEIKGKLSGCDMVFITCGLGGGTGTGSAPIIAEVSKKIGALTVAIVTMPFQVEGQRRYENAVIGLEKLQNIVDTLIVIPNDKLLELAPDLPLHTAFKVADEILTNAVKGIAELVTRTGLVNLDFADIRAVMGNGGVALIGVGESDTENRALEAVEKAVNNPLLSVDITGANGALINVSGGSDMTLDEAKTVVETISEKLDEEARIIWGLR